MAKARSSGKNLFVYFSAPWCGWCHKLQNYLDREDVHAAFSKAYIPVNIDVDRMTQGTDIRNRYGVSEDDGLPFFVIVDAGGKKLADAKGPKGNVGFPAESFEIDHFIKVVRAHGPRITSAQAATLRRGLASGR
jgi:thiol-disulfide isomerase/thioredoxin